MSALKKIMADTEKYCYVDARTGALLEKNMTRTEFEQRVKDENLKIEDYSIDLDEYREEIRVMGCVQKNGK